VSERRDGGRIALSGFLYQTLGVLGIVAAGTCEGADFDDPGLNALLRITRRADVSGEGFDQDAFMVDSSTGAIVERRAILAQFKFSRDPNAPTTRMYPKALQEDVIDKLDDAANAAKRLGYKPSAYVLVTNRTLGPGAWKKARVRQLQASDDLFLVSAGSDDDTKPILYVANVPTINEWIEKLEAFGRRLGATSDEIAKGINELIGQLVSDARTVDKIVDETMLIEAFTGSATALFLTSDDVTSRSHEKLANVSLKPTQALARRRVVEKIADLSRQRAMVVVHGLGGCGKTSALYQWADETIAYADTHNFATFSGSFTHIDAADRVNPRWATGIICDWAMHPAISGRRSAAANESLERLIIANPDVTHPILHLGLDGLDEEIRSDQRNDDVDDVLRWFFEEDKRVFRSTDPPRMTLIVTCRKGPQEIVERLGLNRDAFPYEGPLPAEVLVDDFSPDELIDAASNMPPVLRARIEGMVRSSGVSAAGASLQLVDFADYRSVSSVGSFTPTARVDADIATALRHPVIWGAFRRLHEVDQMAALNGDPDAVRRLARGVVTRTCVKARQRNSAAFGKQAFVFVLLRAVAQNTDGYKPNMLRQWMTVGQAVDLQPGAGTVQALYEEALSAGIIREESLTMWRWHHRMIWEYLKTSSEDEWREFSSW